MINDILPLFPDLQSTQRVPRTGDEHGDTLVLQEIEVKDKEKFNKATDLVVGYETPNEGWNSNQVRDLLRNEHEEWILNVADWKTFLTLTFREEKTPDVANSLFKWFIRQNNQHAFGKHYTQKVGHSYFSYVVGLEYQRRDVIHFHVLVDKPIDFAFIHKFWGDRCGFAWIEGNLSSKAKAVNYICKYCVKGGELNVFKVKMDYVPKILPNWWR